MASTAAADRTRASAKWTPPFQYHCDRNHEIHADREIGKCPAVVEGTPCPGTLTRHGTGSRS